jgi:hypothetical protein
VSCLKINIAAAMLLFKISQININKQSKKSGEKEKRSKAF